MSVAGVILGVFAMLGFLAVGSFLVFYVHGWSERRSRRQTYEDALRRFEARPRGKVLKIGTMIRDELGHEHPWQFSFDCQGRVPAVAQGIHGEILLAGYTFAELSEMARRRSEFE